MAVPVALLAMGLQERTPAKAEAAPRPIKVVRVTKVVKVKQVKRVVQGAPIVRPEIVTTAPSTPAPAESEKPDTPAKSRAVVGGDAPARRKSAPKSDTVAGGGSTESCSGDACGGESAPASSPSF